MLLLPSIRRNGVRFGSSSVFAMLCVLESVARDIILGITTKNSKTNIKHYLLVTFCHLCMLIMSLIIYISHLYDGSQISLHVFTKIEQLDSQDANVASGVLILKRYLVLIKLNCDLNNATTLVNIF